MKMWYIDVFLLIIQVDSSFLVWKNKAPIEMLRCSFGDILNGVHKYRYNTIFNLLCYNENKFMLYSIFILI